MYKKIQEKKSEFVSLLPDDQDFFDWLDQSNLWCCLFSMLKLTGKQVSKNTVVSMISGEILEDVPLSLYAFSKSLRDVYADMKSYISMQSTLDKRMLNRWMGMFPESDGAEALYRLKNPVVREWNLIPVHFRSIDEEFDALFKRVQRVKSEMDPVSAVSYMHLAIDKLYPYGENTVVMAFLAVMYRLMQLGIPMPELLTDPDAYNRAVAAFVNNADISSFNDVLMKSICTRLDSICSMLRQYE